MTTTTVHAIGKCVIKGCKQRKRHTLPGTITTDKYGTRTSWGMESPYGRMHPGSSWGSATPSLGEMAHYIRSFRDGEDCYERMWAEAMLNYGWICPDHDRVMKVVAVKGTVNIDKSCDGRCMNATSGACDCSCGGELHGASWN